MMDIKKLEWLKGESEYFGDMKIQHAIAQHSFRDLQPAIGVDPGRNWGIGFVLPQDHPVLGHLGYSLSTYWGTMPKEDKTQDYFHKIRDFVKLWIPPKCPAKIVMVENAAFNAPYGREYLEQIRLGFYEAFRELGFPVEYVNPQTPRLKVLGGGRNKGKEIWLSINGNAADAAVIALYASGYLYKIDK